jgi:thioredoxin-like negative regulator of GroEL
MYNLKNPILILFYADWCGHCKKFMPTWEEFIKTRINSEEYNVIQIESANPFAQRIKGLQGYPTIYYIHGEKLIEYNGNRDIESLEKFLEKNKDV